MTKNAIDISLAKTWNKYFITNKNLSVPFALSAPVGKEFQVKP
jgi:hypothetical protein